MQSSGLILNDFFSCVGGFRSVSNGINLWNILFELVSGYVYDNQKWESIFCLFLNYV